MGPIEHTMRDFEDLFRALGKSRFRSRFRLGAKEAAYVQRRGLEAILAHAEQFVRDRLAEAQPANDGRQTPMRNHPVFIAQHATATCCRGCLAKWHRIPKGRVLTVDEIRYIVSVVEYWLRQQPVSAGSSQRECPGSSEKTLFSPQQ